ncbi:hypothetical protein GCM10010840_33830 [Deinococcus aerolatus]|uniref:Type I restriction modification DNA specificity domain-containing protein n=1 Tax=Deinococcus aerolatus TaxID=522487 RepID=A0ABQ2GG77_9DEIO|nr:hypothetical protein GCM10010840_33830 [Deinococcus aerolatus]
MTLGDLGELKQGPTLSRFLEPAGSEYRILQISNLRDLTVQPHEDDRKEFLDGPRAAEHAVQAGQILISLRGSALKAAVVEQDLPDTVVSNSLTTLVPRPDLADPYFLAALLNSAHMQQRVTPLFTGITVQGIPLAKFRKLAIHLPVLSEQQKLARVLRALAEYRRAVQGVLTLREEEIEAHLQPFVVQENV